MIISTSFTLAVDYLSQLSTFHIRIWDWQRMNSKKVGGEYSSTAGTSSRKANNFQAFDSVSGYPKLEQLSRDMGDFTTDPMQNDEWEVIGKKKNKVGAVAGKQGNANSTPKTWVQPGTGRSSPTSWTSSSDSRMAVGRWNPKQQPGIKNCESASMTSQTSSIPPPLQHGWNWGARGGSAVNSQKNQNVCTSSVVDSAHNQPEGFSGDDDDDDDAALVDESDEDFSDDYDSDASQRSHETRKMNKWFKGFFENLDKLTLDEMGEQTRQWHCPACHNGPGAIDWYDGLQPLMTHAKTKRSTRPRLHRELALLLDEELRRRGTSVIPAGEAFGKWKGLRESTTDREIVWPPMVIVMNTILEKDDNDKWIGMGNQELLEYFNSYAAKKARHSYGPHGHRGMSVLIFEPSAIGYMEAERLHKHFVVQGTSREAWERSNHALFYHGGKRQLYGYLARKEDLDIFNQHSQGKSRLKFDVRSYQEMVVIPMKQMSEDNQQLTYLKNKVVKEKEISKSLRDTVVSVTLKLRETSEDNRIVRLRTKMQQDESKEMMDSQERFFKDKMEKIHKDTEEKEKQYEKLLQDERAKAKFADSNSGYGRDCSLSKKFEEFIVSQTKDVEAFESQREQLIKAHDEKKISLRRRHLAEEVELEKEFDASLTQLMEEYAPSSFQNSDTD